jgi:Raf kinase inhibitor-like YbhB/YbcL family protein
MQLQSVFKNNEKIPIKYTADGDDINPPLNILNVPKNTKSFVLIIEDPDAPARIWTHWAVFNIPPDIRNIEENNVPKNSKLGENSAKILTYHGPSPPSGIHRYFFKLYALDIMLDLPEGTSKTEIEKEMSGHIIEKAELMGVYGR